jgi:aminomethyltransferase
MAPAPRLLVSIARTRSGGILDDLIVYRLGAERVLVVCNASNRDKISGHFAANVGGVRFRDASDETALIAFQGPLAVGLLARAKTELPDPFAAFSVHESTVAGRPCILARTGYTGEDGVEIFCAGGDAAAIWRARLDAGRTAGVAPIGLGARDTLRLEARLALYGNDIDETTNPIEAGLGWVVKLGKTDFIGKDAIAAIKAQGPARRLAGFEMTGRGIARHGYPLLDTTGNEVGACTSGAPSPTLGKSIGLGYLPVGLSSVGSAIQVDCRGKPVAAQVVPTPFYKRARPG